MCCKFSPSSNGNVEHSAVRCPCQGTTNPGLPKAETLPTTIVPFTPKGPCTQIVDTLALKYLFKEKSIYIYTIWAHGPLVRGRHFGSRTFGQRPRFRWLCSAWGRLVWCCLRPSGLLSPRGRDSLETWLRNPGLITPK